MYLDFDSPTRAIAYDDLVYRLRCFRLCPVAVAYHRTRNGWHVIVYTHERLRPAETVAAQFALGSDPVRERLMFARVRSLKCQSRFWRARWNLLYEDKLP